MLLGGDGRGGQEGVDEVEHLHHSLVLPEVLVGLEDEGVLVTVGGEHRHPLGPLLCGVDLELRSE